MPFENALFQRDQTFLWPVTILVFAVFAYAVMSLGAFGVEWIRRHKQPGSVLALTGANARSPEVLELATRKELAQAYTEALKATGLRESNQAVQRFAAAEVNPANAASPARPAAAERPAKQAAPTRQQNHEAAAALAQTSGA